ncbi:hypothetical protein Dimus_025907 [Dionaea muscipula]
MRRDPHEKKKKGKHNFPISNLCPIGESRRRRFPLSFLFFLPPDSHPSLSVITSHLKFSLKSISSDSNPQFPSSFHSNFTIPIQLLHRISSHHQLVDPSDFDPRITNHRAPPHHHQLSRVLDSFD